MWYWARRERCHNLFPFRRGGTTILRRAASGTIWAVAAERAPLHIWLQDQQPAALGRAKTQSPRLQRKRLSLLDGAIDL